MDEATISARAQDTLDSQGWNTQGAVYSSTHLRTGAILARLREQIIEMAPGHASTASAVDIMYVTSYQIVFFSVAEAYTFLQ
jgi:hypothetical protein